MEKKEDKYTLDCDYFKNEYSSLQALLDDIGPSGMDPNYEITKNGEGTGETAWDHLKDFV